MRRRWLAVPILTCATACSPVKTYREAAQSLRFHLERVEPQVRLSLPVDRSRVAFRVVLGVENPSSVPFHVLGFTGDLGLEWRGTTRSIGRLELARPLDLPAGGTARLDVDLSFGYGELRDNWVAITSIADGGRGAWHLEGTLKAEAYGLPLQLPVRTSRAFGGGA